MAKRIGNYSGRPKLGVSNSLTYDAASAMNIAFAHAMLDARHAGLETSFTLGALIDESPLVPTRFTPEPIRSGATSSAALCAELTLDERTPAKKARR